MPDPLTPAQHVEALIEHLETVKRGADRTVASDNALAHAKALEDWLALHAERVAERAKFDRLSR